MTTTGARRIRGGSSSLRCGRFSIVWLLLIPLFLVALPAWADETTPAPSLHVLAIGVGHYQDGAIPTLQYTDDDARSIVAWAEAQKGRLYREVYTQLLIDRQATRREIVKALLDISKIAAPQDQIVVFLAGHGLIEQETGRYHYLSFDSETGNLAGTALEQDDILQKLDTGADQSHRLLLLIDSCHSGALADSLVGRKSDKRGAVLVSGGPKPITDEQVADRLSLWAVFSAGTARDLAGEGADYRLPGEPPEREGHGLFTFALLQALDSVAADRDHNGIVTLTEFQQHVTRVVRDRSFGAQLPVMSGRLMDVALAWAPGSAEICDGIDNTLDGRVDEGFPDSNGNGVADCLDHEVCNGIDDNGDGRIDEGFDLDGDGFNSRQLCGQFGNDCDDGSLSVHPGQKDWGNLIDDDCDGRYDEDDFDRDTDGVPDHMQRRADRLKQARRAALALGGALGTAGVAAFARMNMLIAPEGDYEVSPSDVSRYSRLSALTLTLGGGGMLFLGVSGSFGVAELQFRKQYFPHARVFPKPPWR